EPRRNSPSVIVSRPASSCIRIASQMLRSSTSRYAASLIWPAAWALKASRSSRGRSRLPICSARCGSLSFDVSAIDDLLVSPLAANAAASGGDAADCRAGRAGSARGTAQDHRVNPARHQLAEAQLGVEPPVLDDHLAAQHRHRRPSLDLPVLPGAVVGYMKILALKAPGDRRVD